MESVEEETTTLEAVDEEQQIVEWRFEQLRRVGFGPELALDLAIATGIDLHKATDLVLRGCSPELAFRILR